jgi:class 3 adenylate cyclase
MVTDLESRLGGTRAKHISQEFFTNSAHFPLANVFLELLIEGLPSYVTAPDPYVIITASLVQAYFLGGWHHAGRPRPFLGNLIGPALYTLIEATIEGPRFFASSHHLAYWGFSLAIGALQELRLRLPGKAAEVLILLENLVRASILLAMYWIFEAFLNPRNRSLSGFLSDRSHLFVGVVIPLLGLIIGLANITAARYLGTLHETAAQLRKYSEWLLGRDLLSRAVADPAALTLQRRERTVLFMDIRGFTRWSEPQAPERVVAMLNAYYETAERVWSDSAAIKVKLSADEVMAVFPTPQAAARTALILRREIDSFLKTHGLAAGIGLNTGPLVEGLLGSQDMKGYDVLGDTVNTAKRLCDIAEAGEILLSRTTFAALGGEAVVLEARQVTVKGKNDPLVIYPLQELTDRERDSTPQGRGTRTSRGA